MTSGEIQVRRAKVDDAETIARLLHDFNLEYDEPTADVPTQTAARGLYDSLGFSNREGGPDGPAMLFYEREI